MKRRRLVILVMLLFVLLPSVAAARIGERIRWENSQRYRFHGLVDFSYRNYSEEINGVKKEEKTFQQRYSLGLDGYIWKPRLAIFSAKASFDISNQTPQNDSRNIGFNVTTLFFPRTRFPLFLYANRSTYTNDSSLNLNRTSTTTSFSAEWHYSTLTNKKVSLGYGHSIYDIDNGTSGKSSSVFDYFSFKFISSPYYGKRGLLNNFRNNNLRNNNLRNNAGNTSGNNDNSNDSEDEDRSETKDNNSNGNNGNGNNGNYRNNSNLSRRLGPDYGLGITWGVGYEMQNFRTSGDVTSDANKSHRFSLFANRNLFGFGATSELVFYKTDTSKDTTLSLSLERKTQKFNSYSSYVLNKTDDRNMQTTSHAISSYNNYDYSKNLSFNGSLSYNRNTTESGTSNSYGMNLGSRYTYTKNYDTSVLNAYAGTGLGTSRSSGINSSSSSIALSVNYGANYETFMRTKGYFSYKYDANFAGTADSDGNLNNRLGAGISTSRAFRFFTLSNSAYIYHTMNNQKGSSYGNGLSLGLSAGFYARVTRFSTFAATAEYSKSLAGGSSSQSLKLDERLNITLYRNLYLSVIGLQTTTSTESSTYESNEIRASINYRIRKLYLGGEYNMSSQVDTDGNRTDKKVIFLRASRPF